MQAGSACLSHSCVPPEAFISDTYFISPVRNIIYFFAFIIDSRHNRTLRQRFHILILYTDVANYWYTFSDFYNKNAHSGLIFSLFQSVCLPLKRSWKISRFIYALTCRRVRHFLYRMLSEIRMIGFCFRNSFFNVYYKICIVPD